ncbi:MULTISPECIES: hypothetical protein [Polyangium]|uniref:Uncharacterized protein n=2 Tax=Polyangium TaxID=55 RepID=A0A4V5PM54_9BACT|nr:MULTISPECIES: hypothetical protein [Polyangium]MDI1432708.1 hypothetical protein [Polyangium sorediatum]TKD01976.1 hypothetical protein E8A74_29355 [Polyangium fumosum]
MNRISLTGFVDFVLEAGAGGDGDPLKERKGDSAPDYYHPLRDAIVQMHREDLLPATLDAAITREPSEKKRRVFARVIEGYRRFLATGTMKWFDPPRTSYRMGAHNVDVAPELGLAIDETPHVIKMYFRGEPLTPRRTSVMLSLLAGRLGRICPGHVFAVLDVRHGKLHAVSTPEERFGILRASNEGR